MDTPLIHLLKEFVIVAIVDVNSNEHRAGCVEGLLEHRGDLVRRLDHEAACSERPVSGKSKDEGRIVSRLKCRGHSTLVEKSVESSDTLSTDRCLTKPSSSVCNQLPRSRLEGVFGRRSALFTGVERDQMLGERGKMTSDTGVQRKLILANVRGVELVIDNCATDRSLRPS